MFCNYSLLVLLLFFFFFFFPPSVTRTRQYFPFQLPVTVCREGAGGLSVETFFTVVEHVV